MIHRNVIGALALSTAALVSSAHASTTPVSHPVQDEEKPSVATIAKHAAKHFVRVEYTLKFDKGEAPYGGGWTYYCANCGTYHGEDLAAIMEEERMPTRSGYLTTPSTVFTSDPLVHPRFIESISVLAGDQRVAARIAGYGTDQNAILLQLEEAITEATPIEFFASDRNSHYAVTHGELNGGWTTSISPLSTQITIDETGRSFSTAPNDCLIVNDLGQPVALCLNGSLDADESWKTSPLHWDLVSADQLEQLVRNLEDVANNAILRVELGFRSPRQSAADVDPWGYGGGDDSATEQNATGIVVDANTVLVTHHLEQKTTARLERVRVHAGDGRVIPASFKASLQNYGAFLVHLDEPINGVPGLAADDIRNYRDELIMDAEVLIQGEIRTPYFMHGRIPGFSKGWREHIYPDLNSEIDFYFNLDGELIAFPVTRRTRVSDDNRWDSEYPVMTASTYIVEVLNNLPEHIDPNNIPLSEEDENRIAWLGVEMQELDQDLARASNVSDQTSDGMTGAIVTYIYEGSPAANAGIQVGDILLRIMSPAIPTPLDVTTGGMGFFGNEMFPWDQLDDIPDEYFDQIPTPWPSASNHMAGQLTDLGFGTPYALEFVRNGETQTVDMVVEESPSYYVSAPQKEHEELGLTVRDMTYEVRRYFQRSADDPGIVISKLEPGSRASIAGLRPFEVITHVNDNPVHSAEEFMTQLDGQSELRFSVRRMTRGRVVQITLQ